MEKGHCQRRCPEPRGRKGRWRREGGEEICSSFRNLSAPGPGCQGGYCHHVLHSPHPHWEIYRTHPLATAPWTVGHHPLPLLASVGTGSNTCEVEAESFGKVSHRSSHRPERRVHFMELKCFLVCPPLDHPSILLSLRINP